MFYLDAVSESVSKIKSHSLFGVRFANDKRCKTNRTKKTMLLTKEQLPSVISKHAELENGLQGLMEVKWVLLRVSKHVSLEGKLEFL
jgi:hypothetical protein